MKPEDLNERVDDPLDGDDDVGGTIRYAISSYGADMPVDGVVDRLNREDIFIPPFQRKFVWNQAQASRFIESLLLGLPVPGIFLFKEPASRRLMVVDGQQRLLTLQCFYDGLIRSKKFDLIGVCDEFAGKTYRTLSDDDQRELNDSILHATIFQQDQPSDDRSSIYSVFERLNTGGTPLQPQEIRACVYRGAFNDLLSELAGNAHWKDLYGPGSSRKKDEEIILRFLALYSSLKTYERPMKQFLNDFMDRHKDMTDALSDEYRAKFENTVKIVAEVLEPRALRPERNLNVSVADAVLVGIAHRLDIGPVSDHGALRSAHERLLKKLRDGQLFTSGTTDKERVMMRINLARSEYESS